MKLQKHHHCIYISLTPKKFFLEVMGGPCFEPHNVAVPTCWWDLHLGGALLPARDTGAQQAAQSFAYCLYLISKMPTHSLGWGLKNHHTMVRCFELHGKWVFSLGPFFSSCTVFFCVAFSPHSHTHFQILIQLPVQPITSATAAPKSRNFEFFLSWNRRWVVLIKFCTII